MIAGAIAIVLFGGLASGQSCDNPVFSGIAGSTPIGDGPRAVKLTDLDGDGSPEAVVLVTDDDSVAVHSDYVDGVFQSVSSIVVGNNIRGLGIGDLDGNGYKDIVVGDLETDRIAVLLNSQNSLSQPTYYDTALNPFDLEVVDINGDGLLDIAVACLGDVGSRPGAVLVFRGDGVGGFFTSDTERMGDHPWALRVGDLDSDGDQDLVTTNYFEDRVYVRYMQGNGNFGNPDFYAVGKIPNDIDVLDMDGDGDLDLAFSHLLDDTVWVMRRRPDGFFEPSQIVPAGDRPEEVLARDVDGDGDFDLCIRMGSVVGAGFLLNDGAGNFDSFEETLDGGSAGFDLADIDGDLDHDIIATQLGDQLNVYLNASIARSQWTGTSVLYNAESSWDSGVPGSTLPNTPVFDSSVEPFGPVGFVLLDNDVAVRSFLQSTSDVELLMNGFDAQVIGLNSIGGDIALELGVEQCGGGDPLPITPPLLRIGNAAAGSSSTFTAARASIGRTGPASLELDGTAANIRLDIPGDLVIGEGAAGLVRIPANAPRSEITYGGSLEESLVIGAGADGTVELFAGCLTANSSVARAVLGRDPGVTGSARVDGAQTAGPCGSVWTHTGTSFVVGESGHGVIEITDGARLSTSVTNTIVLAQEPGSSATVLISGSGSEWDAGFSLIETGSGTANVIVDAGGTISGFGLVNSATSALRGDGTIFAPFTGIVNLGDIAPSVSTAGSGTPATLRLEGDFRQIDFPSDPRRSGRVLLDLFEVGGSFLADRVEITGATDLAGAVIVSAPAGFDPGVGDVIPLLSTAQAIGSDRVDVALLPGLPDGKFFRISYDLEGSGSGSVSLVVDSLGDDLSFGGPNDTAVKGIAAAAELRDMNGDGLPDVILAIPDDTNPTTAPGSVLVLLNGGDADNNGEWDGFTGGVLQANTGIDPSDVAVGDLDGDLIPDIAISNRQDGTASLFVNNGVGLPVAFADIVFNQAPEAIVIGDLDEDGRNDVAVVGSDMDSSGQLTTRLNAGGVGGGWNGLSAGLDFDIGQGPTFMDIGDLDNDSCLDLLIGSEGDGGVNLLNNLAGGQGGDWAGFAAPLTFITGSAPFAGDIGDLDNDSCLDISVIDRESAELFVILHSGGPGVFTFTPPAGIPAGGANPRSVVISDLDGDSDGDIAVVTDSDDGLSRVVRLLRNDLDPGVGQLQFAPSTLVPTAGEPLLVLADNVDGTSGQDLVAITDVSGEQGRRGPSGLTGGVSTALNIDATASGCNAADLAMPFGLLDLSDISTFTSAFVATDLLADVNSDGVFDLSDIASFIGAFVAGCP